MNELKSIDFTVAMCVWRGDNASHFEDALRSIFDQTVQPSRVVLVVDGPVPHDTEQVIAEYSRTGKMDVTRLPIASGHGQARRAGFNACTTDYVAIMDADDIALSNRFELQTAILARDPAIDVLGGAIGEFASDPLVLDSVRRLPTSHGDLMQEIGRRCPFNQVTVMVRREAVERAGGYQDWYHNEDYYLWARMALAGCNFANTDEVLVRVRVNRDSFRRRGGMNYFRSEVRLQRFLATHGFIGRVRLFKNVAARFLVQVVLPPSARAVVFRKFARERG